ncbi:hypothetical protein [Candidatus Uabimicrobium sp. HlEnr_7]|uniref:hypothetical protein n=1 Tax=Candidatus Uabimicrobium helgolandensis TaxID=3095367 RepID=UPI003556FB10
MASKKLLLWQVGDNTSLGQQTFQDVVLFPKLKKALTALNKKVIGEAIEQALEELAKDRSTLHPVITNREIYRFIRNGIKVSVKTGKKHTLSK